ncbi:MAG: Esterase EstB [Candidatus Lokiarchaeum sp. GC14_75]|nr:MAG: Esterase EstB [Candidatus Lokiarchaeum sp. GC14_75]
MSNEVDIQGYTDPKFEMIKDAFKENFEEFNEVGASFAVFLDNKFVIDIWGGHSNPEKTNLWNKDSIAKVYSTNKVIASICALILVDKGLLDLDAPVARYWPEFAQAGKEKLLVRCLFSHSAGLPGFDEKITVEDLKDWDKIINIIAKQKPWWEPGIKIGYHATTMYYLLGELVRRISGKPINKFFREEIGKPFSIDYHIMLPEKFQTNRADMIPPKVTFSSFVWDETDRNSYLFKVWSNPDLRKVHDNDPIWCEIATRGFGNARSVAKLGSIIANGGFLDGVQILTAGTIAKSMEEQIFDTDLVLGSKNRYGLGWGLKTDYHSLPSPNTAYWGGMGGSSIIMDLDNKMSIAYVMNKMRRQPLDETQKNKYTSDSRGNRLVKTVYELL